MPAESPAVILFDANGVAVAVADDTTIPANTQGLIIAGKDDSGKAQFASMADDEGVKRLRVDSVGSEGDLEDGSPVFEDPTKIFFERLTEGGGSIDLIVDGSGTPVVFSVSADPSVDVFVSEIRVVIISDVQLGQDKFAASEALTNGILIEVDSNGGGDVGLANIKINEDWFMFFRSGASIFHSEGSADDLIAFSYPLGRVKLVAGSSDIVKVTIRDDLPMVSGLQFLQGVVFGIKA